MGRTRGSTWHSDSKIMLALLFSPRRFNEFEWALVREFPFDLPQEYKGKNIDMWRRLERRHIGNWRIPKKTLARRLKSLVAKGWIMRRVLRKHGHHVEYQLNFSKDEEMLKELRVPEFLLTLAQKGLLRKIDSVGPLQEEIAGLDDMPYDEVLEIFLRLRAGEYVCPRCLVRGKGKRALNVSMDTDGKFYCRSCGEEATIEETEELLSETVKKNSAKRFIEGLPEFQRFFSAIDKQLKSVRYRRGREK